MSNAAPTLTTESPPLCQPEAALAVPRKRVPFRTREKQLDVCRMRFLVCVLGGYCQDHGDVHSLAHGVEPANTLEGAGFVSKTAPPRGEWSAPGAQASSTGGGDLGSPCDFMSPAALVGPLPCLRQLSHPKC